MSEASPSGFETVDGPRVHVGLVGARGYAGQVLHALFMQHPCIEAEIVEAHDPGPAVFEACRGLDVVALAVPEAPAHVWASGLLERGVRVLDLSGAHRQVDGIHYGLPELMGAPPKDARLVANPGCYPTATLVPLAALRRAGVIEDEPLAVVGQSGSSGAGKGLREDLHFSELHDNVFPYKVGTHRHVPEIERYLGAAISFVTELLPIVRGLLVTAFVRPRPGLSPGDLEAALVRTYAPHPYVTVIGEAGLGLGVRHVVGTHQAVVAVGPVARGGVVPVFCAIDNLMRGAASQAVHNLNLWLGLPAFAGLPKPLPAPQGVPGMRP